LGVFKSFRTESIKKSTTTTTTIIIINTHWEATQRVMAAKLTILTHKIAIKLHLLAESSTVCCSRARRPVRKLLDTPSYYDRLVFMHVLRPLWWHIVALQGLSKPLKIPQKINNKHLCPELNSNPELYCAVVPNRWNFKSSGKWDQRKCLITS
jgi:hypothetical protein